MATISAVDFTFNTCLAANGYVFNAETSVWLPPGRTADFPYSDGYETEERLLDSVERAMDVRAGSPSLGEEIRDWTSEYHLSSVRTNLLRPVRHLLRGDTLEIGAGCGALSRYIGELDGRLLSIEGSLRRAQIAAARCRSLDNTSVVCETLDSLRLDYRFDAVVVVGVLEYCRLFNSDGDPCSFLRQCRRFLKPGGCLILAIENKLGLKYFCGAPEDHLSEPFFGIEDRYSNKTAATWGRSELAACLKSAGWNHIQELFPFPDYKLPQLILTRDALTYGPVVCDLLSQYGPAVETGIPFRRPFSEAAAWRTVAQNSLIDELSNSFLFVASESPRREMEGAYVYSSNRHRAFQCETRITRTGGEFSVKKTPLYEDSRPASAKFKWSPAASPFRHGRVYSSLLGAILLRPNWQYEDVIAWARPYFDLLLSRATGTSANGKHATLPGDQLDCGPHNLSLRPDGRLEDFDFEWTALHDLPLDYVFFRSVLHCLRQPTAVAPGSSDDGILNILRAIMSAFALRVDDEVFAEHIQRESQLQSFVSGRPVEASLDSYRQLKLKQRLLSSSELEQLTAELTNARAALANEKALTEKLTVEARQAQLADEQRLQAAERQLLGELRIRAELEHSLSWAITKPLRGIKAQLYRFFHTLRTIRARAAVGKCADYSVRPDSF